MYQLSKAREHLKSLYNLFLSSFQEGCPAGLLGYDDGGGFGGYAFIKVFYGVISGLVGFGGVFFGVSVGFAFGYYGVVCLGAGDGAIQSDGHYGYGFFKFFGFGGVGGGLIVGGIFSV